VWEAVLRPRDRQADVLDDSDVDNNFRSAGILLCRDAACTAHAKVYWKVQGQPLCLSKKEKGEANTAKRWRAGVGRFASDDGPKGYGQRGRPAATSARGNGMSTTSEAGTSQKGRWSRRRKPAGIGSTAIRWSHGASRTKY
jgi:hypothetical protein